MAKQGAGRAGEDCAFRAGGGPSEGHEEVLLIAVALGHSPVFWESWWELLLLLLVGPEGSMV